MVSSFGPNMFKLGVWSSVLEHLAFLWYKKRRADYARWRCLEGRLAATRHIESSPSSIIQTRWSTAWKWCSRLLCSWKWPCDFLEALNVQRAWSRLFYSEFNGPLIFWKPWKFNGRAQGCIRFAKNVLLIFWISWTSNGRAQGFFLFWEKGPHNLFCK